jgi:hypothetical protein
MAEELPGGGTVRDLRRSIVELAKRADEAVQRLAPTPGTPPMTDGDVELFLMAHGTAYHGWALASVLGWLHQKHGDDVATGAAAIVQSIGFDGYVGPWCDDVLG